MTENPTPQEYPKDPKYNYIEPEQKESLLANDQIWKGDKVKGKPDTTFILSIYGPYDDNQPIGEIEVISYGVEEDGTVEYTLSNNIDSWQTTATADEIELVERGQLWKYFHGELPVFDNIVDEAEFHETIGAFATVERSDGQDWTKETLIDAVGEGKVDAFRMSRQSLSFSEKPDTLITLTAYYYQDRDFGNRIASVVLDGFNKPPRKPTATAING